MDVTGHAEFFTWDGHILYCQIHVCILFIMWCIVYFVDEKEKYDPSLFRDAIITGLNETDGDLESVSIKIDWLLVLNITFNNI